MARQTRSERRARRAAQAESRASVDRAPQQRAPQQPARAPAEAQPPSDGQRAAAQPRKRFVFVSESWAELKKVDWPGQQQLIQGTAVVLIACFVTGLYLFAADELFRRLVQHVLLIGNQMFRWYAINTYSGHENKVKTNLEHRIDSMAQQQRFRRVVVPTEQVVETKDGQKVQTEKRILPGYVLVNMDLSDESWTVVKNTPGVTGFVGAGSKPVPLSQGEVDRILRTGAATGERPRAQVEFSLGESVKVTSGPLSDFDGEIVDVNPDQQKLKVLVDIFERQVPVELGFDQVKKID